MSRQFAKTFDISVSNLPGDVEQVRKMASSSTDTENLSRTKSKFSSVFDSVVLGG